MSNCKIGGIKPRSSIDGSKERLFEIMPLDKPLHIIPVFHHLCPAGHVLTGGLCSVQQPSRPAYQIWLLLPHLPHWPVGLPRLQCRRARPGLPILWIRQLSRLRGHHQFRLLRLKRPILWPSNCSLNYSCCALQLFLLITTHSAGRIDCKFSHILN